MKFVLHFLKDHADHERIPEEHRRIVLAVQSKMPVPEDIRSRRPALPFLNETRFGKDRLEILEVREPCVWPHPGRGNIADLPGS